MRIIAGTAKGRVLKMPQGDVRPTADRVKESMFNALGQWMDGEVVLDLFAGAGSLGLEALSRGAREATFVERDRTVLAVLRQNIEELGFARVSTVMPLPVERAIPKLAAAGRRFSLVFADPPYARHVLLPVVEAIDGSGILQPKGRLVLEHDKREELPGRIGALERGDERRYGDTVVSYFEFARK